MLTRNEIEQFTDLIKGYFNDPNNIAAFTSSITKSTKEILDKRMDELELSLNNKLNDLEIKHHEQIKRLEVSFMAELEGVRNSNATLYNQMNADRLKFQDEVDKIHGKIFQIENQDSELFLKLNKAYEMVDNLKNKVHYLEKSSFNNEQHTRKWNIEIDGIPINIGDDQNQLELAVIEILRSINVKCIPADIEAVHRLPSKSPIKPTIVRFNHRKTVDEINLNKHKLKDIVSLNMNINGLNEESRIYINPSLSKYFKNLQFNCRVLKRNGLIKSVKTSNDGTIKIKTLTDEFIKISHESDLIDRFEEFKNFSFS